MVGAVRNLGATSWQIADTAAAAGRTLAAHPACTARRPAAGAATVVPWAPGTAALYRCLSEDLTGPGITVAETILVGRVVKRPGRAAVARRPRSVGASLAALNRTN